ncbi:MAG: ROK family protein [Bacteroidales bacterium]|nr:ROK family protein [Bacteroidales bacterium]
MVLDFLTQSTVISNQSRHQKQKKDIVRYISKSKTACIIPDIAKQLKISIPTINKLIVELLEANVLVEYGKKDTGSGRKPILYALNRDMFYSVGVDIQLKGLRIVMLDIQLQVVKSKDISDFTLENTEECLNDIINHVNEFITYCMVENTAILGLGFSLTGRVDVKKSSSISFFDFMGKPLGQYFSEKFQLPVLLDNDTRLIGLSEQVDGCLSNVKDAIVVNVSRGLGASIICEGNIVKGGNGFAGEFGHMQFGKKERLCICGKTNCLGTEVSGYALELDFTNALDAGRDSLLKLQTDTFGYRQILRSALEGDSLAIELVQKQGMYLGESLGNIINLLNPSLIVIAGSFAILGDMFIDAIRIGLSKTTLINPLNSCRVIASEVDGTRAAAIGAAYLSFKKFDLL